MKDSPGYRRLVQRQGADAYEAMLQDTLKKQREALEGAAHARPQEEPAKPRSRKARRDGQYPPSKPPKKTRT